MGKFEDTMKSGNKQGHTMVGDSIRHASHKIEDFGERAADKSDELYHRGERFASQVQGEVDAHLEKTVAYIQKNPMKATLIAAGVGVLLAKILKL